MSIPILSYFLLFGRWLEEQSPVLLYIQQKGMGIFHRGFGRFFLGLLNFISFAGVTAVMGIGS